MKIVIELPDKTIAHIRSDYGHDVKGLTDEDREIVCDAIYSGTPYEERPHGEWEKYRNGYGFVLVRCSVCKENAIYGEGQPVITNCCPNCGASMRKEGDEK